MARGESVADTLARLAAKGEAEGVQVAYVAGTRWTATSGTVDGRTYDVDLVSGCTCAGWVGHGCCKHYALALRDGIAAAVAAAEGAPAAAPEAPAAAAPAAAPAAAAAIDWAALAGPLAAGLERAHIGRARARHLALIAIRIAAGDQPQREADRITYRGLPGWIVAHHPQLADTLYEAAGRVMLARGETTAD